MIRSKFVISLITLSVLTACSEPSISTLSPDLNLDQTTNIQSAETPEQKYIRRKNLFVENLAYQLHDNWRQTRKKSDGSYEPRIKETKDQDWIANNGGKNQVDIANTIYTKLPSDWQAENKASAVVATDLLYSAIEKNKALDKKFIEDSSSKIHIEWLKRNTYAKGGALDVPYSKLPEVEKEKDRAVIKEAIQLAIDFGLVKS